ncbi:MAG: hypothetical protein HY332_06685 [Chloroflexi bacterium]|nr:hypothetical protein [Chloroflexota bacterium]
MTIGECQHPFRFPPNKKAAGGALFGRAGSRIEVLVLEAHADHRRTHVRLDQREPEHDPARRRRRRQRRACHGSKGRYRLRDRLWGRKSDDRRHKRSQACG